jgi:hypothetical protein
MQRLMTLRRLGAVYGLIEEIHSIEARMAAAEVGEVETALHMEANILQMAWIKERESIRLEDNLGRLAMTAREEMAIRKRGRLKPLLESRKETRELAQTRHIASRLWSERMQSLIDYEAERVTAMQERRAQAASDDRFLAQRWGKKREGLIRRDE